MIDPDGNGRRRGLPVRALAAALVAMVAVAAGADPASARSYRKKAIWGPARIGGVSQFPIYRDLGVNIYEVALRWDQVAPKRPRRPTSPKDRAYHWPSDVTFAVREARRYHMRVMLNLTGAPRWANGGRSHQWAPKRPKDFAHFARAVSRRYRSVHLFQIWSEPTRRQNFRPLAALEATGPRRYARILDAAYGALKRQSRRNLVIGGNSFTTGDVPPRQFIKALRLPNGKPPRMDLYGHNPFGRREPDLAKPPLGYGYADFSDLDTLVRWVDRYLGRPRHRRLKLFLSEYTVATDHPNHEFNFWVTRETQARWAASAFRIVRSWSRIYALGWHRLYDDPPRPGGDEVNRGLLDWKGNKKPSYFAYRDG